MALRASNSLSELSSASEEALNRLGCAYGKSKREEFVEFEVTQPFEFMVRMEDLGGTGREDIRLLMFVPRRETGCSVVIVTPPGNAESTKLASIFVRELVAGLKSKPWKGLGLVRSRTAKILWESWLEGPSSDAKGSGSDSLHE